jgi:uncharacterized RDD family membrane protein YckC
VRGGGRCVIEKEARPPILSGRNAVAAARAMYGERHPMVAVALMKLAREHEWLREWNPAELLLREALAIEEARAEPHPERITDILNRLTAACEAMGREDEAHALRQRAARAAAEIPPPGPAPAFIVQAPARSTPVSRPRRMTPWKRSLLIAICVPAVSFLLFLLLVVWMNLAYPNDPGAGWLLLPAMMVLFPIATLSLLVFGIAGAVGYCRRGRHSDPAAGICGDGLARGAGEPRYASCGRRVAAFMIDSALTSVAAGLLTGMLGAIWAMLNDAHTDHAKAQMFDKVYSVVGIVLPWLYFTVFEASRPQATPGKMLFRIMVTDLEGKRVSFWRANARYWGKLLSVLTFLVGFLMCATTRRRQALHDLVARCLVLRGPMNAASRNDDGQRANTHPVRTS